jgi:hypothetical protein
METKNLFIFFFSFLLVLNLLLSASALDLNFVQNSSNPILTGNSSSTIYEPYNNNTQEGGIAISQGMLKQWFSLNGYTDVYYRSSTDGNIWTNPVRVYSTLNTSILYNSGHQGTAFSVKNVINEFGHTMYYEAFVSERSYTYVYDSVDGINWTKACLGNSIDPYFNTYTVSDLDFAYNPLSYSILISGPDSTYGIRLYNSTTLCSGWVDRGKIISGIEPQILYNSYTGEFSIFYSDNGQNNIYKSFSLAQTGDTLGYLTNKSLTTQQYFFNISMEQTYLHFIDIAQIYDNNANFSHKVYMFFTIDNGGIGVAYDSLNRQLNDILGQENVTINNGTEGNGTTSNYYVGVLGSIVSGFDGIFPQSSTISLTNKLAYVFLFMLLIDLIILLIILFVIKKPEAIGWSILIVDILLFFYFLTIGYIPVAMLIFMILVLLVITYFKIKGGN